MPGFDVWDVIKVPFPYTNRSGKQRRPALIVAVPEAPGTPELLWVLMVTSAANRGWPGDVPVSDLGSAGLPAASVIRCAKIATIEARDAQRIGHLPHDDQRRVVGVLREILAATLPLTGRASGPRVSRP